MTIPTAQPEAPREDAAAAATDLVRFTSVTKIYGNGDGSIAALDDVSLGLPGGSFTAVIRRSPRGSGSAFR